MKKPMQTQILVLLHSLYSLPAALAREEWGKKVQHQTNKTQNCTPPLSNVTLFQSFYKLRTGSMEGSDLPLEVSSRDRTAGWFRY